MGEKIKRITNYKELSTNATESLLNHINKNEIKDKQIIMRYLYDGENIAIACHTLFDYVKNKSTGGNVFLFSDGEFIWNSEDIYHFEKYNMELEQSFINKVLKLSKEKKIIR